MVVYLELLLILPPRTCSRNSAWRFSALTLPADWYFGLHLTFTDAWRTRRLSCDPEVEFDSFKSALTTILQVEPYQKDMARNNPWERLSCSTSYTRLEDDVVLQVCGCHHAPYPSPSTPKRPHALLASVLNALAHARRRPPLMVHRHDDVHRLAELICLIASIIRPEWADYWKRFCPRCDCRMGILSVSSDLH